MQRIRFDVILVSDFTEKAVTVRKPAVVEVDGLGDLQVFRIIGGSTYPVEAKRLLHTVNAHWRISGFEIRGESVTRT